ncbi:MAG: hypothetical protein M3245_03405, partial [Actinomycetota bacterium]|nr:hypothetical protein [Actinomycetota bacterium]
SRVSEETVLLVALGALAVAAGLVSWGSVRLLWRERKARGAHRGTPVTGPEDQERDGPAPTDRR